MSCCAPGTEALLDNNASAEELWLASRDLGNGRRMLDLSIPGIHCGACISTIERSLAKLPEVERARVNLSTRRVAITFHEVVSGTRTDPSKLVRTIRAAGYEAHLFQDMAEKGDELRNQLLIAVAVGGICATKINML